MMGVELKVAICLSQKLKCGHILTNINKQNNYENTSVIATICINTNK